MKTFEEIEGEYNERDKQVKKAEARKDEWEANGRPTISLKDYMEKHGITPESLLEHLQKEAREKSVHPDTLQDWRMVLELDDVTALLPQAYVAGLQQALSVLPGNYNSLVGESKERYGHNLALNDSRSAIEAEIKKIKI